MRKKIQRGFILFSSILILAIILSFVLGFSVILTRQYKVMRTVGYSVNAFYAAETGAEKAVFTALSALKKEENFNYKQEETFDNEAEYTVSIYCCLHSRRSCDFETISECPARDGTAPKIDPNCDATKFCVYSTGSFEGVKRTIEVKIYPEK